MHSQPVKLNKRGINMDISEILQVLKELTLDLAAAKKSRLDTVIELHKKIEADAVYNLPESEPQREFIFQAFVSLDNLVTEGFATSPAEIQYYADCFSGKREFSLEEVRTFEVGDFEKEGLPAKVVKYSPPRKHKTKESGKS
jgi:hypothetical protein